MIEHRLISQREVSQKMLSVFLLLTFLLSGCGSTTSQPDVSGLSGPEIALGRSVHKFLKPRAKELNSSDAPVLQYIHPGGLAQKYGFAVGDRILKINSREITSSSEFQKKIKSVANPTFQIEYKPKFGPQRTRSITLPSPDTYFGASTEPQNIALVKPGSSIASISRGPNTVFCSASINKEGSTLFVNFILDSQMPSRKTPVGIKIIDKTSNKVLGDAVEEVPLSGGNPSLISRSFGVSSNPSRVQVIVGFEKQQFGFEFQN